MANKDFARGMWATGHLTGGQIRSRPYILTSGEILNKGEVVKVVAAGTVEPAAEDDELIVVGVCAGYVSDAASAGGKIVQVWDDPFIIFGVQSVTGQTPTSAEVHSGYDITGCSAATTEVLSNSELSTAGLQVLLLGKVEEPGNEWGEHVDVLVLFNQHRYRAVGAAV